MTDARRWLTAAATGVAGGLLAGLYWDWAHGFNAPCEAHLCWFPFYAALWAIGAGLLPLATWLVLLVTGFRPGARALLVAVLGSTLFGLMVWAWVSLRYGTPRPPYAILVVFGLVGFAAAMGVLAGRTTRLVAGVLAAGLVVAVVVGQVTSPGRDRLHRFTVLAAVGQRPDPARWRVVSAEAYPRYDTVEMVLEPVGGGARIVLLERPVPPGWDPPRNCGPRLAALVSKIAFQAREELPETTCVAYEEGGWQNNTELLDVRGGAVVTAAAESARNAVSLPDLRAVLTSLVPASPKQMADLTE